MPCKRPDKEAVFNWNDQDSGESQGGCEYYGDSLCKQEERHNHPFRKTSAVETFQYLPVSETEDVGAELVLWWTPNKIVVENSNKGRTIQVCYQEQVCPKMILRHLNVV